MTESSSRRTFMAVASLTATGLAVSTPAHSAPLPLTPMCVDDDDTPSNIEGPYFKRNSPLRTNLRETGTTGILLSVTGFVYTTKCQPIAKALLDFWQADARGAYDNRGNKMRGHQFTQADGSFVLETVVPKDYPGRTPHLHVKVQAPKGPILTTQLYFPDNMQAYGMDVKRLNQRDRFMKRDCTIPLGPLVGNRYAGKFEFVIDTA